MLTTNPPFDVAFAVPPNPAAAARSVGIAGAGADAATLRLAAPGDEPIENQLQVTLRADPAGPLSGRTPTILKLDLAGYMGAAQAAAITLVSSGAGWAIAKNGSQLVLTLDGPLDVATTSLLLGGVVVTQVAVRQPIVSLAGQLAARQNRLLVVQAPGHGNQHLDLVPSWSGAAIVPIADPAAAQPPTLVFDLDRTGGGIAATGGSVQVWFDTQDDGTAPGAGDLGCQTQVAAFTVQADGSYGSTWTLGIAGAGDPPTWTFTSTQPLLPEGKARLCITGALPPLSPNGAPNLAGFANCYVQVTIPGYDPQLVAGAIDKAIPLRRVDVRAETPSVQVLSQSPFSFVADVTEVSGPVDLAVDIAVDRLMDSLTFHLPQDSAPGLAIGQPIHLRGLSLVRRPLVYDLTVGAHGRAFVRGRVGFIGVTFTHGGDFDGLSLPGIDLTSRDLGHATGVGADLTGACLHKTDFTAATLTGIVLRDATCTQTLFPDADLTKADLGGADLDGAVMTGTILGLARLRGAKNVLHATGLDPKWVTVWTIVSVGAASAGALAGADLSSAWLEDAPMAGAALHGTNLTGSDLTGANLTGADLSAAQLGQATLTGAKLEQANLTGALLLDKSVGLAPKWKTVWELVTVGPSGVDLSDPSRLDFSDAYLRGVNLSGIRLAGANFARADLTGALLNGCDLTGCVLGGATMNGAQIGAGAILDGLHLEGVALAGANLDGARLHGTHLDGATLTGCALGADVTGATFTGAALDFADWRGATGVDEAVGLAPKWLTVWRVVNGPPLPAAAEALLSCGAPARPAPTRPGYPGADFANALLAGGALYRCDVSGADFTGARLGGADFSGATVAGADFTGADIGRALFGHVVLTGAKGIEQAVNAGKWLRVQRLQAGELAAAGPLAGANFDHADLQDVDFAGASLAGASLQGTDLRGAHLAGCDLSGTNLSATVLTGQDLSKVKSLAGAYLDYIQWHGVVGVDGAPGVTPDFVALWLLAIQGPNTPGAAEVPVGGLMRGNFSCVSWPNAQLAGRGFMGTLFFGANLDGIDLSDGGGFGLSSIDGTTFRGAKLQGSKFGRVSARGADFTGADLTGAKLTKVDLAGAIWDGTTKWPAGFDPSPPTRSAP